jgi:hypothetical protein
MRYTSTNLVGAPYAASVSFTSNISDSTHFIFSNQAHLVAIIVSQIMQQAGSYA